MVTSWLAKPKEASVCNMNAKRSGLYVLVLVTALPALAADQQVSLPQLVEHIMAKDDANQQALKSVQYHEKLVLEQLGEGGQGHRRQEADMIIRPGGSPEVQVLSMQGDDLPSDPDEAAAHAKGQEEQRKRTNLSLRELSSRFTLKLLGRADLHGESTYLISFEPKPSQPYNNQTEHVLNHLRGKMWIRGSDATVLKTEATLAEPVEIAWVFASITQLDFRYDLLKDVDGIGPCEIKTFVKVNAPLITIRQRMLVDMDKFEPRLPPQVPHLSSH